MVGLLDPNTPGTIDPNDPNYGMTYEERNAPLWAGLMKAGLLGIAAGGEMMPGQRAQMIGQIAGAVGDIPAGLQQARASAAQEVLRRQQIATGQQKLEAQRRFQAYAQSPEMQDAIKKLTPAQQFAVKAAIDAGDVDAFQRIMTGMDTMDLRERKFAL